MRCVARMNSPIVLMLAATVVPCVAFLASTRFSPSSILQMVHAHRDADFYEMMVGGERYEMVPLPDSMLDTTLFVGNLNEFVNDQDLSDLFCGVTDLSSVPACVARKANMASLEYGLVTFPTKQEKENAILKFHNSQFMGKVLKVEEIRDHPKRGRVWVPERMVAYVIGDVKQTSSREINAMRRVSNPASSSSKKMKNKSKRQHEPQKRKQPQKRKLVAYTLAAKEQEGLQRAVRNGFVTLNGTGFRRGRKTCNLACAHRQWCDAEVSKPQIVLCKASGGRPLDCVIVDLSPLRIVDGYESWNQQIEAAAQMAGMALRSDYVEDNCQEELTENQQELPISNLPAISMGVFEGERSQAKAMTRELASLWDLPLEQEMPGQQEQSTRKPRGNEKRKGRRNQRREENDFSFF
jgi:hypothetical protein